MACYFNEAGESFSEIEMLRLIAMLLTLSFAGCGAAAGVRAVPSASTFSVTSVGEPAAHRAMLVYVSDHVNNVIDVFDRYGHLQYTLRSGLDAPAGLFVDDAHRLWVANPGANDVLVFARGATKPGEILDDTNQPNDVAVCARRLAAEQSGAGGLESYVTCDAAGNVFATGFIGLSPFTATVGWRHGRESGYYLLPQAAWSSSGIKATRAKTLLIATYENSKPAVLEFTEGGEPTGTVIETGSDLWGDLALSATQTVVFGVDSPQDAVVARKLPSGSLDGIYTNANLAEPAGVAVDPGE